MASSHDDNEAMLPGWSELIGFLVAESKVEQGQGTRNNDRQVPEEPQDCSSASLRIQYGVAW